MQHVCYTDTYIGLKSQLGNNHKSRASQKSCFPPDLSSLLLTPFQKEPMRTKKIHLNSFVTGIIPVVVHAELNHHPISEREWRRPSRSFHQGIRADDQTSSPA